MKNNNELQEDMIEALSTAWLGLLAVATSVNPDISFEDKTLAEIKNNLLDNVRATSPKATPPDHHIIFDCVTSRNVAIAA